MIQKNMVKDPTLLKNEVDNLVLLDHPNIVKLFETYENDEYLFMVQEYCEFSFSKFLKKNKLNEEMVRQLLKQLLSALVYCHKLGVIHRDIKFQNIMFSHENDIKSLKLIDFGLSGHIDSTNTQFSRAMGTAVYLAPEVILGEYNEKVDIWSVGVLIYYMLNGVPPFNGRDARELYENIIHGASINYVPKVQGASDLLNDLLAKMLKYDKNERIPAHQAIRHVFILVKQAQSAFEAVPAKVLDDLFLNRIADFLKKNKLLKLFAFQYSARWRDCYCQPLKEALAQIDTDNDGIISYQEFMSALELFNSVTSQKKYTKEEAELIFNALDANSNGQIDYLEFQCLFAAQILFRDEKSLFNEFKRIDSVDFC